MNHLFSGSRGMGMAGRHANQVTAFPQSWSIGLKPTAKPTRCGGGLPASASHRSRRHRRLPRTFLPIADRRGRSKPSSSGIARSDRGIWSSSRRIESRLGTSAAVNLRRGEFEKISSVSSRERQLRRPLPGSNPTAAGSAVTHVCEDLQCPDGRPGGLGGLCRHGGSRMANVDPVPGPSLAASRCRRAARPDGGTIAKPRPSPPCARVVAGRPGESARTRAAETRRDARAVSIDIDATSAPSMRRARPRRRRRSA